MPTLDGDRYESVGVIVAQLIREGPEGIFVVTGWEVLESYERDRTILGH